MNGTETAVTWGLVAVEWTALAVWAVRGLVGRASRAADADLAELPAGDDAMAVADAAQEPESPIYNRLFLESVDVALWELELDTAGGAR